MRAVPTRDTILPTDRGRSGSLDEPRTSGARMTVRRSVAALRMVPLLDAVPKRHLRRLAEEADVVRFGPGRPVVREGEGGEAMFVVLSGTARVVRGARKVATLMPGDFFGELSALDGGARTASVVAETPLELLRVFRHTLRRLLEQEPTIAMGLLEGVARRLRHVQPGRPVA